MLSLLVFASLPAITIAKMFAASPIGVSTKNATSKILSKTIQSSGIYPSCVSSTVISEIRMSENFDEVFAEYVSESLNNSKLFTKVEKNHYN